MNKQITKPSINRCKDCGRDISYDTGWIETDDVGSQTFTQPEMIYIKGLCNDCKRKEIKE